MFERFSDLARAVVLQAQEEARALDHDFIGTEHLMLGLLTQPDGTGGKALEMAGFTHDGVRDEVIERIGRGGGPASGRIAFTPRAKKVLELALRQALRLKHDYIGTEHILLALIQEGEGVAAMIMAARTEPETIKRGVFALLGVDAPADDPLTGRLEGIGRMMRERLRGSLRVEESSADDETRKRLEAIEARLSAIEQLLRRQLGDEEAV